MKFFSIDYLINCSILLAGYTQPGWLPTPVFFNATCPKLVVKPSHSHWTLCKFHIIMLLCNEGQSMVLTGEAFAFCAFHVNVSVKLSLTIWLWMYHVVAPVDAISNYMSSSEALGWQGCRKPLGTPRLHSRSRGLHLQKVILVILYFVYLITNTR